MRIGYIFIVVFEVAVPTRDNSHFAEVCASNNIHKFNHNWVILCSMEDVLVSVCIWEVVIRMVILYVNLSLRSVHALQKAF